MKFFKIDGRFDVICSGSLIGNQASCSFEMDVLFEIFRDYATIGGMPEVVNTYIKNKNFSGTLGIQKQLPKDYEEDITKYVDGLDKAKVKAVYNHISTFLAKESYQ